jgi:predicted metalloprotease with PDZ domain
MFCLFIIASKQMHAQFHWLAVTSTNKPIRKSVKLKKNKFGFGILFDRNRTIREIEKGSVAYKSELEVGDKIMCINGFECTSADMVKQLADTQFSIIISVSKTEGIDDWESADTAEADTAEADTAEADTQTQAEADTP